MRLEIINHSVLDVEILRYQGTKIIFSKTIPTTATTAKNGNESSSFRMLARKLKLSRAQM